MAIAWGLRSANTSPNRNQPVPFSLSRFPLVIGHCLRCLCAIVIFLWLFVFVCLSLPGFGTHLSVPRCSPSLLLSPLASASSPAPTLHALDSLTAPTPPLQACSRRTHPVSRCAHVSVDQSDCRRNRCRTRHWARHRAQVRRRRSGCRVRFADIRELRESSGRSSSARSQGLGLRS